jgi:MFS family permease
VTGFGFMVQMASSNTVIQTIVDNEKRGRVMSFCVMAFLGTAPFGSLIAGSLSQRIGAGPTLTLGGACCMVRPTYVRLGVLPEVATGIANAAELSVPPEG